MSLLCSSHYHHSFVLLILLQKKKHLGSSSRIHASDLYKSWARTSVEQTQPFRHLYYRLLRGPPAMCVLTKLWLDSLFFVNFQVTTWPRRILWDLPNSTLQPQSITYPLLSILSLALPDFPQTGVISKLCFFVSSNSRCCAGLWSLLKLTEEWVHVCADLCSYWSCLKYTRFADGITDSVPFRLMTILRLMPMELCSLATRPVNFQEF